MVLATATAEAHSSPTTLDWRCLADSAAWTALVLLVLLAPLLATRRLVGQASEPIPGPILVLLATGIAAAFVLPRLWLLPVGVASYRQGARFWLVLAIPSVALAVLLVAIMTPGTSWLAAATALLFAGVIERLFWRHVAVALRSQSGSTPSPSAESSREPTDDEADVDESYPANLLQQIVRTRESSGEAIHAILRAEFQSGEQMQVLHVAFCPPLASAPNLEAYTTGEREAEVKVTAAFNFGARLEVQLAQPAAEPASVLVELTGSS